MTAAAQNSPLRRTTGDHTVFLGDPVQETLFSMVVALLGELSIVRDRLDAHERLLKSAGLPVSPQEVDDFAIDETVAIQGPEVALELRRARRWHADDRSPRQSRASDRQVATAQRRRRRRDGRLGARSEVP